MYCKKRRTPIYLTKPVLKKMSNSIFNMKKVDLDELYWTVTSRAVTEGVLLKKLFLKISQYSYNFIKNRFQHRRFSVNIANIFQEHLFWKSIYRRLLHTSFRVLKEIVLAHFQSLFRGNNHDEFWENEGKIHEGGCVNKFFS